MFDQINLHVQIGDTTKDYFVPPIRAPLNVRNPVTFYDLVGKLNNSLTWLETSVYPCLFVKSHSYALFLIFILL